MTSLDEKSSLVGTTSSFAAARESATKLAALYRDAGISLSPASSLGRLIESSIRLADAWASGTVIDDQDPRPIIWGQHLDRIAHAALPLAEVADRKHHLHQLKKGCLDPLKRDQSAAKDKLWELELWALINSRPGLSAVLAEPDIVVTTESGDIAIACKRVYSLSNAGSSMSDGVSQIKRSGRPGILAVNIEDVTIPADQVVVEANISAASEQLNTANKAFINTFHHHLVQYVATGRISAVMVCTSAPVYLDNKGIVECRQAQVWAHPHLDEQKTRHLKEFWDAMP